MANTLPVRYSPPATDELHPWVYRAIIGLTIWLVLSLWVLFSRGTYEGLTLSIITLFFLILVGIRRLRHDDIRPRIPVRGSAPRFIVIRPGRSASSAV
jgi:hypothetical protein